MNLVTNKQGDACAYYDKLVKILLEHAHGAHHEQHCDPPTEADLIAFFEGLPLAQRDFVGFISLLHTTKFVMTLDHWKVFSEEIVSALPTEGQH